MVPNPTTLNIKTHPSPILLVSGGGLHLLSSIAVAACNLPLGVKIMLMIGIALALIGFGWQYTWPKSEGFISRLELLDGHWWLETGDGATHRASLSGGYAHPMIVILNFRLENGRRRSLALLPDSAEAETLRRLRVWLRTRRNEDEPNQP